MTSPKRAKGLVKSGRARFVDENKICLACPSENIREVETASEHIDKRAVFEKIAAVQNELTGIEKILCSIQCISDPALSCESEEGEPILSDYMSEVAMEKLKTIREIALNRETTINKILDFYLNLYKELASDKTE